MEYLDDIKEFLEDLDAKLKKQLAKADVAEALGDFNEASAKFWKKVAEKTAHGGSADGKVE